MFLGHFWPFLVIFAREDFFQKIWLCHTQLYMAPQHHAKFKKKLMSQSRENLWTNKRTDGRTNGQTLFHRTIPAEAGGPKKCSTKCKSLKRKKLNIIGIFWMWVRIVRTDLYTTENYDKKSYNNLKTIFDNNELVLHGP